MLAEPPVYADGNIVLDEVQTSRVIEMAWEDRTPFAAIEHSYGLDETAVIKLMRHELKPSSFRLWRERVTGRNTKHEPNATLKWAALIARLSINRVSASQIISYFNTH